MPAWGDTDGHSWATIIVVISAVPRIPVVIIRARRAYIDANTTRSGINSNLRHSRRGGEDCRGCENTDRDLLHDLLLSLLREKTSGESRSSCVYTFANFTINLMEQFV
jgi:hypothetical protein